MIGIYKITNQKTGKAYIGQSICIEHRWKTHIQSAKNPNNKDYNSEFYTDIRNIGVENFKFEILEECLADDLDKKEIFYISIFNTYKNGYNRTCGGSGQNHEDIIKVRNLWDKGYSSAEITNELKICRETVRKYLQDYKNYSTKESYKRGYFNSEKAIQANENLNTNIICQYTLDGILLKEFSSCSEVEKTLGILAQSVSSCIKGEYFSAGGFRWAKKGEELISLDKWNSIHRNKILSDSNIQQIKELLTLGLKRQDIVDQTGCSLKTISRINNGERYNDGLVYPIYDYKKKKSNRQTSR